MRPCRGCGIRKVRLGSLVHVREGPEGAVAGGSKSFSWIVTASVTESQFGVFSVRTAPAPRDRSWNDVVPSGGELAGMKTSAPVMNGSALRTGSGVLRSV